MASVKNLLSSGKSFICKHTIFTVVLIMEVLLLTAFGCFLATRQDVSVSIPLDITTASNEKDSQRVSQDANQTADQKGTENNVQETQFDIGGVALHLGGYETEVDYEFTADKSSSGNVAEGGQITFINNQTKDIIAGGDLVLTDLGSKEHGRLYTGYGQTINIVARPSGNGTLHIRNFSLKENVGFRFTLFFGLLVVILLVDAVYLFIISKKISNKTKKVCGVIATISIIAGLPFFMNVLFGSNGHDIRFHLERIAAVSSEMADGNVPVRMMTDMVNEHAYPNSIFYCDIFLYVPALLYLMFVPLQTCYQIYCILIGLVTCATAYCCLSKITRSSKVSLVGSALYTLSNYRLIDLALRAAIGELTAMAFLPLVILGLYNIYTTKNPKFRDWAPLGIGMGLITMCHIISLELCLGFIVMFCLIMFKKTFKKGRLFGLAKATLLCVGISIWFVLPFADYTANQPVDVMGRGSEAFFSQSGIYPIQYLNSLDAATSSGAVDNVIAGMQNEMSFGLGVSILAGMVLVGWLLIYNRKNQKIEKTKYCAIVILTAIGCISLFLGSYLFPWEVILSVLPASITKIVATIQFPWRFMSIATVSFVFAIAITLSCIGQTALQKFLNRICFALVALVAISATHYLYSVPHTEENFVMNYASTKSLTWIGAGEYLPAGTKTDNVYHKAVKITEGSPENLDYQKHDDEYVLTYNNSSTKKAKVIIPVFAYRYMETTDNFGNKVNTTISDEKLISVDLPPNSSGEMRTKFNAPFTWHLAEIVSFGACLFCGFMYIHTRKNKTTR